VSVACVSFRQGKDSELIGWFRLARISTDRSFVQQAKLFDGLDAASLDTILAAATPRSVPRGATLFKQGDKPCVGDTRYVRVL
jgi:hypothetical protein